MVAAGAFLCAHRILIAVGLHVRKSDNGPLYCIMAVIILWCYLNKD